VRTSSTDRSGIDIMAKAIGFVSGAAPRAVNRVTRIGEIHRILFAFKAYSSGDPAFRRRAPRQLLSTGHPQQREVRRSVHWTMVFNSPRVHRNARARHLGHRLRRGPVANDQTHSARQFGLCISSRCNRSQAANMSSTILASAAVSLSRAVSTTSAYSSRERVAPPVFRVTTCSIPKEYSKLRARALRALAHPSIPALVDEPPGPKHSIARMISPGPPYA